MAAFSLNRLRAAGASASSALSLSLLASNHTPRRRGFALVTSLRSGHNFARCLVKLLPTLW
jgi:hypothetical protein